MIPFGRRGQTQNDSLLDFSGAIASGGTAQLILPQQLRRAFLQIENSSDDNLYFAIGPAKAHATISGGKVTGVTVDNGGIGYTIPPVVQFLGGLVDGDYQQTSPGPGTVVPVGYTFQPAVAQAVLTGDAVSAITVSNGGQGYLVAPLVYLYNPTPALGGGALKAASGVGLVLVPGGSATFDNEVPWDPVSVWGPNADATYVCQVMIG